MFLKLAFILMFAYAASGVAVWDQCGGQNYAGSTECDAGSACVVVNQWYYQCQPVSSGQSNVAKEWEQCGGIGFTGYTMCDAQLTCVYVNAWYSQCQRLGYGSTTSTTPTTASTTTTTTTTTATTTTTTGTTTSSSTTRVATTTGSATAKIWEKCGGIGYTGPTICDTGLTCVYVNDWYSQCRNTNPSTTPQTTTTSSTSTTPPQSSTSSQSTTTGSPGPNKLNGCSFAYGRAFDYSANYSNFDYITIWIGTADWYGSTDFNQYYQGVMLNDAVRYNKLPVLYAYIVAFEGRNIWGLKDCDVGSPNLCQRGADFIRQYRSYLVGRYAYQAQNIAGYIGTNAKVVFLIEPDFYQYYSDSSQQNGPLSGTYMRSLFDDFCQAIRTYLPNAIISWDISPWATQSQMTTWWGFFQSSPYIDYIHTSGGSARPDLANIKPNELTWSFMSQLTGKKIIADCGYGVGGSGANNCFGWTVSSNLINRINDGVVALSQGTLNYEPTLEAAIC